MNRVSSARPLALVFAAWLGAASEVRAREPAFTAPAFAEGESGLEALPSNYETLNGEFRAAFGDILSYLALQDAIAGAGFGLEWGDPERADESLDAARREFDRLRGRRATDSPSVAAMRARVEALEAEYLRRGGSPEGIAAAREEADEAGRAEKAIVAIARYRRAWEGFMAGLDGLEARRLRGATDAPPLPFVDWEVCPFECCAYGKWIAARDFDALEYPEDGAPIAFSVRRGELVYAVTGVGTIRNPRVARATRRIEFDPPLPDIPEGASVHILTYEGEGFASGFHAGRIHPIGLWDFEPAEPSEMEWRILIQRANGDTGWAIDRSDGESNFGIPGECSGFALP